MALWHCKGFPSLAVKPRRFQADGHGPATGCAEPSQDADKPIASGPAEQPAIGTTLPRPKNWETRYGRTSGATDTAVEARRGALESRLPDCGRIVCVTMTQTTRVAQLLAEGRAKLTADDGHREAELLLARALARDRAWLRAHDTDPVDPKASARYREWLHRRSQGTPVAYLLGEREFWSLPLRVSPAVLIPRADTERLVELALARIAIEQPTRIADLGTGSGAIALAIARERPQSQLVATDASTAALAVAEENARALGLSDRIQLRHGSWLAALAGETPFDVIVSNPPYIAADDPHLAQGDLRFEPQLALSSGSDGLDATRQIVRDATDYLVAGGWLLLEHGHDQAQAVRRLLDEAGFDAIRSDTDLGGNDRVSQGRKRARRKT